MKAETIKKISIAVAITLLFVFVYMISSILLPFVMGIVIAYLLDPITEKLTRKWIPRGLSAAIVLTGFFVLVVAVIMLLFPLLKSQSMLFAQKIPVYANALWVKIEPILNTIKENAADKDIDLNIKESLSAHAEDIIKITIGVFTKIITSGVALFNVMGLVFITPVVAFYLLKDWKNFTNSSEGLIPSKYKSEAMEVMGKIDGALAGWIRGQLSVCIVLAVYYAITLSIVGLDVAIAIGVFTGLMTAIPYVGWSLGALAGIGVAFAQFGDQHMMIVIVGAIFLIGQFIESNFLTPNLIGGNIDLHPVWMIFALLAGGALCGFVGFLIAVPVAAIAAVLIRHFVPKMRSNYKKA